MSKRTKETLLALLRAAVAMTIFVLGVINYEKLKNIDVRALVEASTGMIAAVGTIFGIYIIKSAYSFNNCTDSSVFIFYQYFTSFVVR